MRLLVRTWNVFHGNAEPPRRAGFLRKMVELASGDRPDVLCLQEVPVWALRRLGDWSRMSCFWAVARPPLWLGPVSTWVTRAHQGLFRSGLAGQANAILVAPEHTATDLGHEQISEGRRERRVVHAVRVAPHVTPRDGARDTPIAVVVGNLHASNEFGDPTVPRAEARRASAFVDRLAQPGESVILAGDFNVADPRLEGYSTPRVGIDDVLVRGAHVVEVTVWSRERRTRDGVVLSDHAPVDCAVELDAS
jgi:endonuclease/exonuclease/phosphatase family metal-dependent hydrolase